MYRVNIATSKNFTTTLNKLVENYGEDFEKLNGLHESQMNYGDFMDSFTKDNLTEVTIDPNANASNKDICSLNIEKGKPHDKLRSFNKIFHELQKKYGIKVARRWLESEWSGAFYLSNASSSSLIPYCFSYSLDRLADEGLFFLNNDYNNEPPQHLDTFNSDVIEFISFTSNRSSGAVGLGDYLFWNFYFWKKDKDAGKFWSRDPKSGTFIETSERARRQAFQEFIYRLNQPFLRVDQSAFTNISIYDKLYLKELFGSKLLHDGTLVEDCLDDLMEHQKVFMEEIAVTREHNMFTFPVISYSLLYQDNKFQDEETVKWACGHNMKWFDGNFLVSPDITMTSQCCRIVNSTKKLKGFMSSIGGSSLNVGSIQVNTINLQRIALESGGNEEEFISILKERVLLCQQTLDVIRGIIKRNIEKGILNNYKEGLIDMAKQFSTIGIMGVYEVIEYFGYINEDEFGYKSYSDKGILFASKILDKINEFKEEFKCDYTFNVEAIPGENCAKILCRKDELLFNLTRKRPVYSNQWIPLIEKCSFKEKCRLGSLLDVKCGGGQISTFSLDAPITDFEVMWKLLDTISKSGVMYFTFNTKISGCRHNHGFYGDICPTCGEQKTKEFSRVVGFITPTKNWSKERQEEYSLRQYYDFKGEVK